MTGRDFCFWLQGFFELSRTDNISATQVQMIQSHLAMVFKHEIDPSMGGVERQEALNNLHATQALPPHMSNTLVRC